MNLPVIIAELTTVSSHVALLFDIAGDAYALLFNTVELGLPTPITHWLYLNPEKPTGWDPLSAFSCTITALPIIEYCEVKPERRDWLKKRLIRLASRKR